MEDTVTNSDGAAFACVQKAPHGSKSYRQDPGILHEPVLPIFIRPANRPVHRVTIVVAGTSGLARHWPGKTLAWQDAAGHQGGVYRLLEAALLHSSRPAQRSDTSRFAHMLQVHWDRKQGKWDSILEVVDDCRQLGRVADDRKAIFGEFSWIWRDFANPAGYRRNFP